MSYTGASQRSGADLQIKASRTRAIERRLRFPLPVEKLRDTETLRERLTSSETMLLLSVMIVLLAVAVDPAQGQGEKHQEL